MDPLSLPAWVVPYILTKTITHTEAGVLSLVDSFDRGDGSWVTNGVLARSMEVQPLTIKRAVKKLKQTGLLHQTGWIWYKKKKCRVLRTVRSLRSNGAPVSCPDTQLYSSLILKDSTLSPQPDPPGPGMRARVIEEGNEKQGTSMGRKPFFGETPTPEKKTDPSVQDQIWAKELRTFLVENTTAKKKANLKSWANHFRLLRADVDEIDDRIQAALEWLVKNYHKKYTPKPRCGKTFRTKFPQIEAAMAREQEDQPIEVTEFAVSVAKPLMGLGWPKSSKAHVPAAVQKLLDAHKALRDKVKAFAKAHPKGSKPRAATAFAHHLVASHDFATSSAFADHWLRRFLDRVREWDGWSGDLVKQTWGGDPGNKEFKAYMRQMAVRWGGDPGDWDKLSDLLEW